MRSVALALAWLWAVGFAHGAPAPSLALPGRATNALTGSAFLASLNGLSLPAREAAVYDQIMSGNVPRFLRALCPVAVTNVAEGQTNVGTFFVTPDYLAVGDDQDYALMPMTPATAQRLADRLGCALPTRRMVDAIDAAAEVKLAPAPIPPGPAMTTPAVFAQHNEMVRTQRVALLAAQPPGALVAGHKKDVVISAKLAAMTNRVAIYGWHRRDGRPIQPLYTGHTATWVDYSHGIRLVSRQMEVNGEPMDLATVLADPKLAGLLSDEGVVTNARYPTNLPADLNPGNHGAREVARAAGVDARWPEGFVPGSYPGELVRELRQPRGVRIVVNAPATNPAATNLPVRLIFYATPNGNTIEQTMGRKLKPGDDWHFDIQHIAAQTRFLRRVWTNQTVVVAYLENALKSWPAWRKQNGDEPIPEMIQAVEDLFARRPRELVLTGHSGGGSWTFGYLNTVTDLPREVGRIAFLDSNYAYESARHADKLARWLTASDQHFLCVLAYHDSLARLNGKPFVSEQGGTWGRSQAMLADLGRRFQFTSRTNDSLRVHAALDGRVRFLLLENPDRKILHTVQVERNGFIHALLCGTPFEGRGYEYPGPRAYTPWIAEE
jgi:hypothetical protein